MHAREPHTNFIPTTKIIMQALVEFIREALYALQSKLNFTFLRFPLSQRSIFYKMILASKAQMVTTNPGSHNLNPRDSGHKNPKRIPEWYQNADYDIRDKVTSLVSENHIKSQF